MFGLSFEDERTLHERIAYAILLQSVPIFIILYWVVPAPWGKTVNTNFGPLIPARLAWFVFESPNLIWSYICWRREMELVNQILLALFVLHYLQRCVIYPLLLSANTTPMPLTVVLAALSFCTFNG